MLSVIWCFDLLVEWQEEHPACKKYCCNELKKFTFADWPDVEQLWENGPVKLQPHMYCVIGTGITHVRWASRQRADAAAVSGRQMWNDVVATILNRWCHIRSLSPSFDVYLLEEKSCEISSWSNLKWRNLRLFSVKWRHGHYGESVTSYQKSYCINRCVPEYLLHHHHHHHQEEQSCQISSLFEMMET